MLCWLVDYPCTAAMNGETLSELNNNMAKKLKDTVFVPRGNRPGARMLSNQMKPNIHPSSAMDDTSDENLDPNDVSNLNMLMHHSLEFQNERKYMRELLKSGISFTVLTVIMLIVMSSLLAANSRNAVVIVFGGIGAGCLFISICIWIVYGVKRAKQQLIKRATYHQVGIDR